MTTLESPRRGGPAERREVASRGRWWRRPWVIPLLLLITVFLVFSVPPYLTGDRSTSRLPTHPELWWYYPALVAHIVFGTVALVTGAFQLWPWFRRRSPRLHRRLGRAYFFAGTFPAGIAVLLISPLSSTGLVSQWGNTTLALLWLPISLAGWWSVRQRRFAEHRRWMIRGYALTLSIVLNRPWSVMMLMLCAPNALADGASIAGDPQAMMAIGVGTWLSWFVNLAIAELWLERTDAHRRRKPRRHE